MIISVCAPEAAEAASGAWIPKKGSPHTVEAW